MERIVREVLSATDGNSYYVNEFLASSRNLIGRSGASLGGDASNHVKVVGQIRGGSVGAIRLDSSRALTDYQRGLLESINRSMAHVIGIPDPAPRRA